MKKFYLLLLFCLSIIVSKAQMFTQGDVSVMPQPMMNHDSTICSSTCNLFYSITITNSFMGDSVKIKDMSSGYLITSDVNVSGANPWYVYLSVPVYNMFISDDQVSGGSVLFFGPTVKVISGPDTIFNINNVYPFSVSNPCSYGSVSGRVYIDNNSDCVFNTGDVALTSIPVTSNSNLNSPSMSSTNASGYSNGSGAYNINVQQSWLVDYNVAIPSNYQFIFPSSACSPGSYNFTTVPQTNVDFSLQCTSNVDVQCYAGSSGIVRPNVPFYLYPSVSNTGCDSASGQLKLILDNRVAYNAGLSSAPLPAVSGDTLTWNYSNLTNLTSGGYWNSFFANVHLTPNTSVGAGDLLCFTVYTNPPVADINSSNNEFYFCLPVVNSYDPNFKEVSPEGVGTEGYFSTPPDSVLTYTIHFQNTGTAAALNISIIDTLDADLNPKSLQILGASHSVTPEWIAPGVVKFNFYNINLADSSSNEAASHGSVSYRIKMRGGLAYGTQIKNTADIYFDFNPAIVTNTTIRTLTGPLGITEQKQNANFNVFPNPFSESTTFVIQSDKLNETYFFEMTDVLGKKVKQTATMEKQFKISREGLQNGMYFYNITDSKGVVGKGKVIIK
jgi:uncharacterized repeat protein (TIGR01451 family)